MGSKTAPRGQVTDQRGSSSAKNQRTRERAAGPFPAAPKGRGAVQDGRPRGGGRGESGRCSGAGGRGKVGGRATRPPKPLPEDRERVPGAAAMRKIAVECREKGYEIRAAVAAAAAAEGGAKRTAAIAAVAGSRARLAMAKAARAGSGTKLVSALMGAMSQAGFRSGVSRLALKEAIQRLNEKNLEVSRAAAGKTLAGLCQEHASMVSEDPLQPVVVPAFFEDEHLPIQVRISRSSLACFQFCAFSKYQSSLFRNLCAEYSE